jgi:hypothetical protein
VEKVFLFSIQTRLGKLGENSPNLVTLIITQIGFNFFVDVAVSSLLALCQGDQMNL